MENLREYLNEETQKALKGKNIAINVHNKKEKLKYSKVQYAAIYKGYDMLENLFTVRTYIQRRYNLDHYLFEVLLKLMGLKVWTLKQFTSLPKPFNLGRLQNLLDTGLVNLIMDDTDHDKKIYCLNTKGRNIVVHFYEYLSGEKKIPEQSKFNPLAKEITPYDRRKMEIIKQMNRMPVPEHKKTLFKDISARNPIHH